jgi:DNA recombination protein Rad52
MGLFKLILQHGVMKMTSKLNLNQDTITKLESKLSRDVIKQREGGGGTSLSYLEGWYVQDQANKIFGHGGWSQRVIQINQVMQRQYINKYNKPMVQYAYMAVVEIAVHDEQGNTIVRQDSGTGDGQASEAMPYQAIELAIKEAVTDATKRAFKSLGNQFGLALYDKEQKQVGGLTEAQKNWKEQQEKLITGLPSTEAVAAWLVNSEAKLARLESSDEEDIKQVARNLRKLAHTKMEKLKSEQENEQ